MIHLYDIVDEADLKDAMGARLVRQAHSGDGQSLFTYTHAANTTPGAWDNPAVRLCRGLIVESETLVVVARPFAKFFNHNQPEALTLDDSRPLQWFDKLDGSLGILHRAPDGLPRIATRGSFHSEQAKHATQLFRERYADECDWYEYGYTSLFEIIYPENRIVLDYKGMDDLVLLGAVEHGDGFVFDPAFSATMIGWPGPVAEQLPSQAQRDNKEGVVALGYTRDGKRAMVKFKQSDYLEKHRLVTGMSERKVWEMMMQGKTLTEITTPLPDELLGWVTEVYDRLWDEAWAVVNEVNTEFRQAVARASNDRPAFARVVANSKHRNLLFMQYDNKPSYDLFLTVLKGLKPKETR